MTRPLMAQLAAITAATAATGPALAGDFGFSFSFSRHGHRHRGVDAGVVIGRQPIVVAPAHVVVAPAPVVAVPVVPVVPVRPIFVPPVYTTISERVWVPTVQTRFRDVPVYDICGRIVSYRREPYTVASGYWTVVQRRVIAREGYWTTAVDAAPAPAGPTPEYEALETDENYGNVGHAPRSIPRGSGLRPIPGTVRASAIQ